MFFTTSTAVQISKDRAVSSTQSPVVNANVLSSSIIRPTLLSLLNILLINIIILLGLLIG